MDAVDSACNWLVLSDNSLSRVLTLRAGGVADELVRFFLD